jgi:hypothetical protein
VKITEAVADLAAEMISHAGRIADVKSSDPLINGLLNHLVVVSRESGVQLAAAIAAMTPEQRARINETVAI